MSDCLVEQKAEFVEVLLDEGFSLKRFLTPAELRSLYNKIVSLEPKKKNVEKKRQLIVFFS